MAIAAELGLSRERIKGLESAAIHDIGKIEIPAEILSKPVRLTEIEYLLVKSHAQVGYEMASLLVSREQGRGEGA